MRPIDADILKKALFVICDACRYCPHNNFEDIIDKAPTVEEPKYILKVKNLTAEDKKHFKECWNKSAGGLLAIPDNYEIVPIERPQGEWTDLSTDGRHIGWIACSVCGQEPPNESNLRTNFCPNCGAKMKGGAE